LISSVLAPEIYCANQILLISKPQIIIKMKKYIPKLLAIFTLILLTSCSSDDEHDHGVTADQIPAIQAALISGDWIISHYSTKFGSDQTATYSAYSFSFLNNGILSATDGTTALTGSWSVVEDIHPTNEKLNHVHLNVIFSAPETFVEISDDWDMKTFNATKIDLNAVLSEGASTQTLTFTKK